MRGGTWTALALVGALTISGASVQEVDLQRSAPRLLNDAAARSSLVRRLPFRERTCAGLGAEWLLAHQE